MRLYSAAIKSICQLILSIERGRLIDLDYRRAAGLPLTYDFGFFQKRKTVYKLKFTPSKNNS